MSILHPVIEDTHSSEKMYEDIFRLECLGAVIWVQRFVFSYVCDEKIKKKIFLTIYFYEFHIPCLGVRYSPVKYWHILPEHPV